MHKQLSPNQPAASVVVRQNMLARVVAPVLTAAAAAPKLVATQGTPVRQIRPPLFLGPPSPSLGLVVGSGDAAAAPVAGLLAGRPAAGVASRKV